MALDTIFNENMHPVFVNEPEEVKRRLRAPYPENWTKVCIGETHMVVGVPEYLYGDKYDEVLGMLKELIRKSDLPMYQRNPGRLDIYLESTARKIIERALEK